VGQPVAVEDEIHSLCRRLEKCHLELSMLKKGHRENALRCHWICILGFLCHVVRVENRSCRLREGQVDEVRAKVNLGMNFLARIVLLQLGGNVALVMAHSIF
jgi:hypothetical protein